MVRYRCTASGRNTTMIATDHRTLATTGWCSGQAVETEVGLPNRPRAAATMALMGFQSAMGLSHDGSPSIGTNVLARNVIGNSQPKVAASACAPLLTHRPMYVP